MPEYVGYVKALKESDWEEILGSAKVFIKSTHATDDGEDVSEPEESVFALPPIEVSDDDPEESAPPQFGESLARSLIQLLKVFKVSHGSLPCCDISPPCHDASLPCCDVSLPCCDVSLLHHDDSLPRSDISLPCHDDPSTPDLHYNTYHGAPIPHCDVPTLHHHDSNPSIPYFCHNTYHDAPTPRHCDLPAPHHHDSSSHVAHHDPLPQCKVPDAYHKSSHTDPSMYNYEHPGPSKCSSAFILILIWLEQKRAISLVIGIVFDH